MPTIAPPRTPDSIRRTRALIVFALLASALGRAPAAAQTTTTGPLASVAVFGSSVGDGTSAGVTGGVAYRFNRALAFGIEVTAVPSLTPGDPTPGANGRLEESFVATGGSVSIFPPVIVPIYRYEEEGGRAAIFTTNVRLEIPLASPRVLPYVIGGGGISTVREQFTLTVEYPDFVIQSFPVRPFSQTITQSATDLALTLGGGISFRATDHLWIDADLRYFALLGHVDRHIGRFGGGVSYRF
jgi:opacity protein-like surface antigen